MSRRFGVGASLWLEEQLARLDGPGVSLSVAEVGSRVTARSLADQEPYYALQRRQVIGFEPDPAAAARLAEERLSGTTFLPFAIGRHDGEADLHVTQNPKCSSLYQPNPELIARYVGLEIATEVGRERVSVRRLESALDEARWPTIDLLKVDVQGAELDVLRGAGSRLSEPLALALEVDFVEVYKAAPLFPEVLDFVQRHGFEFHHFIAIGGMPRRDAGAALPGTRPALWADALFVRQVERVTPARAGRLALIASLYECHDLAVSALRRRGDSLGDAYVAWVMVDARRREGQSLWRRLGAATNRRLGTLRRLANVKRL